MQNDHEWKKIEICSYLLNYDENFNKGKLEIKL